MANSLLSRRTMAPQSCNFLTARASCSYRIAQILHVAAVHLSSMLKSTGHFSMCPCFFSRAPYWVSVFIIYKLQLFTTGLHGSCWSISIDVHMVVPNAFMHVHNGNSVITCWRNFAYFEHLWTVSLKPVACEMQISNFLFSLPLFTREWERHSSKSCEGEETAAVGARMLVFFICRGLCSFPGMAEDLHIMSGVFSPEMYRNYKNRHDHETFLCMLSVLWPASEYHHERLCANLHVLYACF